MSCVKLYRIKNQKESVVWTNMAEEAKLFCTKLLPTW